MDFLKLVGCMCEGRGGGVISPNKFKKKRINQFSEKINKENLGPNFFDLKITWPKLFSNRAYPETCVSSMLLRACFHCNLNVFVSLKKEEKSERKKIILWPVELIKSSKILTNKNATTYNCYNCRARQSH